jgi:hypothetical protein
MWYFGRMNRGTNTGRRKFEQKIRRRKKMTSFKRNAFAIVMLAVSLCLGSSKAMAQSTAVLGSFNLPFQAHWGSLSLEPGAYTLKIEREAGGTDVLFLRGPNKSQAKLLGGYSIIKHSDRSYLRVTNTDGTYSVSEFYCGALGQTFQYHTPKVRQLQAKTDKPQETLIAVRNSN